MSTIDDVYKAAGKMLEENGDVSLAELQRDFEHKLDDLIASLWPSLYRLVRVIKRSDSACSRLFIGPRRSGAHGKEQRG